MLQLPQLVARAEYANNLYNLDGSFESGYKNDYYLFFGRGSYLKYQRDYYGYLTDQRTEIAGDGSSYSLRKDFFGITHNDAVPEFATATTELARSGKTSQQTPKHISTAAAAGNAIRTDHIFQPVLAASSAGKHSAQKLLYFHYCLPATIQLKQRSAICSVKQKVVYIWQIFQHPHPSVQ